MQITVDDMNMEGKAETIRAKKSDATSKHFYYHKTFFFFFFLYILMLVLLVLWFLMRVTSPLLLPVYFSDAESDIDMLNQSKYSHNSEENRIFYVILCSTIYIIFCIFFIWFINICFVLAVYSFSSNDEDAETTPLYFHCWQNFSASIVYIFINLYKIWWNKNQKWSHEITQIPM